MARSKKGQPHYQDHIETLTALVTHLAMTDWSLRTPQGLAVALSISEDEVTTVLDTFKSLFRKSRNLSSKNGKPMYALQLRHARQWLVGDADDDEQTKPPLEPEYLTTLLNFIIERSNQEARASEALWTNIVALVISGIALAGSIVSLVLTISA
jgi:hypothetical protein